MSRRVLYVAVGVWAALVAAIVVLELSVGTSLTLGTTMVTLVVAAIPPIVIVSVVGDGDTKTIADMLRQ